MKDVATQWVNKELSALDQEAAGYKHLVDDVINNFGRDKSLNFLAYKVADLVRPKPNEYQMVYIRRAVNNTIFGWW